MHAKRLLLASFAVSLFLLLPMTLFGECNSYPGVTPSHLEDYGYYCGGTGAGCTECYDVQPTGTQVCVYYSLWDVYCTHYGQEYQWP